MRTRVTAETAPKDIVDTAVAVGSFKNLGGGAASAGSRRLPWNRAVHGSPMPHSNRRRAMLEICLVLERSSEGATYHVVPGQVMRPRLKLPSGQDGERRVADDSRDGCARWSTTPRSPAPTSHAPTSDPRDRHRCPFRSSKTRSKAKQLEQRSMKSVANEDHHH